MNKKQLLWVLFLGAWLLATPLSFGQESIPIRISDSASGFLLLVVGTLLLKYPRPLFATPLLLIALWLSFAPLLFWAPTPIEYVNDTGVGMALLLLWFTCIPPHSETETRGGATPPGWSFNPSSWSHRVPAFCFSLICLFTARYLACYQLGYESVAWDPIFTRGTEKVLNSTLSRSFPISDAGLGAFAYTIEAILCLQGGTKRWKQMPWVVIFFGILALPVSLVSLLLIAFQPLIVGSWCFLCIVIAGSMLLIIGFSGAELMATLQFLRFNRSWKVFFGLEKK